MFNFIKRHKKASVLGIAGGLVLAGGVAWAVYLLTLGITGNVSVGKAAWQYSSTIPTVTCTGGMGSATVTSSSMTITATNLFPNDSCTFKPQVQSLSSVASTDDLKVTKITANLPTGWTLDQTGVCGTTIPKSNFTSQPGTAVIVPFKLTATDTAVAGSITGATITAVPASQYDASMCN